MQHDDWTKQLRDRLSDRKAVPPDGLWDDIERALARKRNHLRIVRMRLWIAAAAVAAVVMVGVGYYMNGDDTAKPNVATTAKSVKAKEENNVAKSVKRVLAALSDVTVGRKSVVGEVERQVADGGNIPVACGQSHADTTIEPIPSAEKASSADSNSPSGTAKETVSHDKSKTVDNQRNTSRSPQPLLAYSQRNVSEGGKWSVGVHSTNGFGNVNASNAVTMYAPMDAALASMNPMFSSKDVSFANRHEDKKHYQPVTFGLSASYAVSDRISVTAGVAYTKASSDFTRVSGNSTVTDKQTLHYVGVPVGVNYNVWQTGRFKAYVTAGGQADFNVSATVETENVKTKIDKDRIQWSVGAAVGAQYDVVPKVGVYVEPGVKYYIDNKSDVENVFKSRPCNFSLQVGVRVGLK